MVMLKEIEEERKSIVNQHVMLMYGIFFMFTGISIAIVMLLVPLMSQAQGMGIATAESPLSLSFSNPCEATFIPFPCDFFNIMCTSFSVTPQSIGCYYFSLFFSILMIQAIFLGLIAGQIGEGSALAGLKHCLIMLASVFVIFTFIIKLGILPI
ncbi:MAG: hypothetical protein QW051_03080, partial [Candidatus Aenigmatarchaeota archaeon]